MNAGVPTQLATDAAVDSWVQYRVIAQEVTRGLAQVEISLGRRVE